MNAAARFLLAALLAAPLRAATVGVVPSEIAPIVSAPAFGAVAAVPLAAPSLLTAAPLTAAPLSAPAFAPSPAALPAASLPTAVLPAPLPAALPPASPARVLAPHAAAADGPNPAASIDAEDAAGRALFDQAAAAPARSPADIVAEHSKRPLRDVFIQQEHEGTLLAPDARDSSGNIFRWYRPIEMRPELADAVSGGLRGFSRLVYSARRAFQIQGRGTSEAAWRAWPLAAKLEYLDRLEAAVTVERGPQAAWDGKVSLILERKNAAPGFVTAHPHMEAPPDAHRGDVGARYLQPEIVTAKETPAASVAEALGRARAIIAETGHAGVQFHVFVKAPPRALLAQIDSLDGALQLVNDVLFAKAAAAGERNIAHPSLRPWHAGRSARVRELLLKAETSARVPAADDPDSEKHAFVGFRWWGMEDGKAVVSLELRGTSFPWKRSAERMARGLDSAELPKRDDSEARADLTFLSLYAEALARGDAPRVPVRPVVLDPAAAEAALRARARELGVPESAYDGLDALARRLTGSARAPEGYLFPFAASPADSPELISFEREVVLLAARLKASEEAGEENPQLARYLFSAIYKEWAQSYGARQDARLAALVRAVAR